MAKNAFLLDTDSYQREVTPIKDWMHQAAWHASVRLNKPFEACLSHIQKKMKEGAVSFKDPTVVFFHRGENGDKHKKTAPLTKYLKFIFQKNQILVPTGTSYIHPSITPSPIVGYLDMNVAKRSTLKKKSAIYEFQGEKLLYQWYNQGQDNAKRANNAVSGGFVAGGSVIQNTSAHSTLTSITRSISSLSNASNERVIGGTRHYYTYDVVYNNIVSICSNTDYQTLEETLRFYDLHYPTVEDAMRCIRRSTDLYYRDSKKTKELQDFVSQLSPIQRAAFVYTGDLYHIRECNPTFIRNLVTELSRSGDTAPTDDVRNKLRKFDEQIVNYAHQVSLSLLKGAGKDYDKLPDETVYIVYNTCLNIANTVEKYRLFFKAFFLTRNHPATIATISNMERRSVVLSDTDSTMFSTDEWVIWYFGKLRFDDPGFAVGGAIAYIATQSIAHILAHFSANMNVDKKRLFTLAMKPEYVFPVFAQTSVAKHYYTAMIVKEGSVYKDIKMEIKGVHMKDSTLPKEITSGSAKLMEKIIRKVMDGEELDLNETIDEVVSVEKRINHSVITGQTEFLKRIRIKDRSAYKVVAKEGELDKSNYRHYVLWEEVFAKHYGSIPQPPYQAISIPLNLPNKTAVVRWLGGLENRVFAADFADWLNRNGMITMQQIHLPIDYCNNHGVPKELIPVVDVLRITLTTTKSYRNILESLGFFSKKDRMIMTQV